MYYKRQQQYCYLEHIIKYIDIHQGTHQDVNPVQLMKTQPTATTKTNTVNTLKANTNLINALCEQIEKLLIIKEGSTC